MLPTLYESSFISLQTLWIFVVVAFLISGYLTIQRLKRARQNFTVLINSSAFMMICALLLSRIVYFVFHTDTYIPAFDLRTIWSFLSIWDKGFSFWGAIIGGGAALTYKLYNTEENKSKWSDSMIVPIMIGIMIGEIGALLGGYSYGSPTDLPWGIRYDIFNVKYTVPIHPTQIYTIITLILILWSKRILSRKTNFFKTDGNTAIYFMTTSSFAFFLLEFLRGDDTLTVFSVRIPAILFLLLCIGSAHLLYKRIKHPTYEHNESANA